MTEDVSNLLKKLEYFAPKLNYGDPGMDQELGRKIQSRDRIGYHWPCVDGIQEISNTVAKCYPEGESGPLLSVGCGIALVEKLVSLMGIKVIATDPCFTHGSENIPTGKLKPYMDIENLTAKKAVEKYPKANCYLTVWPTYEGKWTGDFIEQVVEKKNPLTRIIHIGEEECGCTGDVKFHRLLDENFELESEIQGKTWPGIHDFVQIWGPKTPDSDDEE